MWYAPFYQPKVQKELEEVGSPHSLVGATVVTQKVTRSGHPSARKPLVVAPSLAKIVVGRGEVTFTHHSVQQSEVDCHLPHELTDMEDKCATSMVPLRHTALTEHSTVMFHGFSPTKKYSHGKKTIQLYTGQLPQVSSGPSIQLAPVTEDLSGPECVVRLTITAAPEAGDEQDLVGEDTAEDIPLPHPRDAEGTRKSHNAVTSRHRRRYRQLNGHKSGRFALTFACLKWCMNSTLP